jgi:hypothetical protein
MEIIEITAAVAAKALETVDFGLCSDLGEPVPGQMCVEAAVCFALGLPHGDEPSCVAKSLRSFNVTLNDAGWSSNQARAKGLRRLALVQLGSADHLDELEFARRLVELAIRTVVPAAMRSAASIQEDPKSRESLLRNASACEREGTRSAAFSAATAIDAIFADESAPDYAVWAARGAVNAAANIATAKVAGRICVDVAAAAEAAASAAAEAAASAAAAKVAAKAASTAAYDKSLAAFAEEVVQLLIEMKAPGSQWLGLTTAPSLS